MKSFGWFAAISPLAALGLWAADHSALATTRYRIESKTQQTVDLSAVQQPNQVTNTTQVAIISVTLTDTTGGKTIHVVIDSLSTDLPVPGAAEAALSAKGAWLHGIVDPWGRTKIVKTSADSNEIVGQLKASLQRFFPVVKPGGKQGDTWVDTTQVDSKTPQQAVKSTSITTYTLGGAAQYAGMSATKIDAVSNTTGAGTIENPMAGPMELTLTDQAKESFYVGANGHYLGGTSQSSVKSFVTTPMVPNPIPVTATRSTTVTVLK
ncbi:MAG: hypothetical protein ACYC2K_03420 [Gemmatimonadales bacterium]